MLGPQHGSGASALPAERSPPWRGEHGSLSAAAANSEGPRIPRSTLLAAHVAGVTTPPGMGRETGDQPKESQVTTTPTPKGTMDKRSVDKWLKEKLTGETPTEGVFTAAAASAAETIATHGASTTDKTETIQKQSRKTL